MVVNGPAEIEVPDAVRVIRLPENLGVPAGRNVGARTCRGEIVAFLDDDAELAAPTIAGELDEAFAADPALGVVSMRVLDPGSGTSQRRHVPTLRKTDPAASRYATSFLGGACAIRRTTFEELGGLPGQFFFTLEETDFSWRALDAGHRILYRGDLVAHHPPTAASRHPDFVRLTARNRVWLVRRRLPWILAPVYLGLWTAITLLRSRNQTSWRAHFAGLRAGFDGSAGPRDPMRWATVARMTRLGRPPIV